MSGATWRGVARCAPEQRSASGSNMATRAVPKGKFADVRQLAPLPTPGLPRPSSIALRMPRFFPSVC
eukprot:scaffold16041_cov37-Phaeocystis_antarctica.AAC.6